MTPTWAMWGKSIPPAGPVHVVHRLIGEPAAAVVLPDDPLRQPEAWRAAVAIVADGRLTRAAGGAA
jgi:hypothetical protein